MALFTPSASPAVTVKEIDLSGVVPNVQTTTGASVSYTHLTLPTTRHV